MNNWELSARGSALHAFLVEARGRLKPQDVGLPWKSRRILGLRQSDVAELAGVSTRWYEQFEEGKPDRRFSVDFVERVADALRLGDGDRAILFRLALPEVRLAVEHLERSTQEGSLRCLTQMRQLVSRLTAVSSFEEAAEAAVEALEVALKPSCVSVAALVPEYRSRIIAVGPKAVFANSAFVDTFLRYYAFVDSCLAANYPSRYGYTTFNESRPSRKDVAQDGSFTFLQQTSDGHSFVVTADSSSISEDGAPPSSRIGDKAISAEQYWSWNLNMGSRSSLTHGLFEDGAYRGNLAALWAEPHAMSSFEIETLRTATALVELAAAGRASSSPR